MPIDKSCISPPVEAGCSLLDTMHLPPHVHLALEYVSSRLARRGLDISLVVLRGNEHASMLRPTQSPTFRSCSPASQSPSSPRLFKRSTSKSSLRSLSNSSSVSSASSTISLSRTNWPSLPASPRAASPPQSPISIQPSTPSSPNPYGITLMYAGTLTAKAQKILRRAITRADKKFHIGSGRLPAQPSSASTNDLIHRSLLQNEVLFSSDGLKLLVADHVYTFKYHLNAYSRTLSKSHLTSAVDELRRLVLSHHGRQIAESYLRQAYAWLGVSLAALVDVNEGYKVAYGGPRRLDGIELPSRDKRLPPLMRNFGVREVPGLKLQTTFGDCVKGMVEHGEDRGPHYRGPATPSREDDFTPVTRGEWSCLLVDGGWVIKTAAIESC